MIIKEVSAKVIADSRNQPTIEVSINGCSASSPAGKSTGKYETPSYCKSIDWNISSINRFEELKGLEIKSFNDLSKIENIIKNKFKLKDVKQFGANALFALECAVLKALAQENSKNLWQVINEKSDKIPTPVGNAIGGGLHSHVSNHPVFQEFLLIPKGRSFKERYANLKSVYNALGIMISSSKVNDEGAWECSLSEEEILECMNKFKDLTDIGIDIASSSFYKKGIYQYKEHGRSKKSQIEYINFLIQEYGIFYSEDPLDEEDFSGFSEIINNRNLRTSVLIVGDDLTVTHIDRLEKAIKNKSINAMIIKPNQNGSLLEVKKVVDLCKKNKIKTILSHRSGETLDNALADLAFGFQTDYIKCGIATPWREVKLQRLLEIENSLQ